MIQIDACKNGDKEALGELYTTYANRLLGVCRHYVKDDNSAHDILHDAFIIIFMSIQDLKDESKLEGWMITIVRNLSLKYLQNTEKEAIPLSCLNIEIQEAACEEQKKIEFGLLLSAIESLPEGNREVFKLSVLEGLSHKEIGKQLGINPHSSSSQLFRAKKTLRAMLINYWMLFLLPILIPVYIYIATRDKTVEISDNGSTATNTHKSQSKYVQKGLGTLKKEESRYSTSPSTASNAGRGSASEIVPEGNIALQVSTDSAITEQRALPFNVDSLQKHLAIGIGTNDSLYCIPQTPQDKMIALNERMNFNACNKKKYPWTFNFGYSSNAGANGAVSNLDYLSLVDYANGGATAKLYTWADLEDYYARNNALMDSVERARMSLILREHPTDDNGSLGEIAHHCRPRTFGLSINKQLSPKWTFGTGITYTRLKSEFESEYNKARLVKTQKIDYVGIPLRLTYQVWSKGRLNAYMTGGMAFEMPVHSSLEKKYIITADSSYTLKRDIKPRYQWSVNLGVGVQYKLFKPFSLYLEPNMFYYFRNSSNLETYRTEHPFIITVPFGLRLTW
ncbi:RNA polymerase subunit sigma-70 [Prevotella intermedia ATCC 25611 = DSM 20706]|uniref:sigma-70 family RNA polymerase sigma factor n=1 Tax=Prevotella intermedia TaxID=28131 RepID=UPI0003F4DB87|nr:sigma-70 family RNA polymerase sigma factor [Prevotella intermedia]APW33029.1 RNA polymerase subunit sigma-70 [Prevotella intermedia ATCC 25611 = DSM 20706]SUB98425.1 RNA polymerase sigma factor sigM [Prevotella intermedia]